MCKYNQNHEWILALEGCSRVRIVYPPSLIWRVKNSLNTEVKFTVTSWCVQMEPIPILLCNVTCCVICMDACVCDL